MFDDAIQAQEDTTVMSWSHPYVGEAHKALFELMRTHCKSETAYGRFLAVVQSSGTGKSRMVDELSKEHLAIPINLRPAYSTGFPPADPSARSFLTTQVYRLDDAYQRHAAFLVALFETMLSSLKDLESDIIKAYTNKPNINALIGEKCSTVAQKFYVLMRNGQSFAKQNVYRTMFYGKVVLRAEELCLTSGDKDLGGDMHSAAQNLVEFLQKQGMLAGPQDVLILSFDEAHELTKPHEYHGREPGIKSWSCFDALRLNLRQLRELPIFSLFISTDSITSDLTPTMIHHPLARVSGQPKLSPPFTEVGFDQLLKDKPIEEYSVEIQEVAEMQFLCQFGRPLFGTRFKYGGSFVRAAMESFALHKLLCKAYDPRTIISEDAILACMSVRLALEFNSTTPEDHERERLQVAKHMRILIKLNDDPETVTVAPSEPILALGARWFMSNELNLASSLLREFRRPHIDKGNRGEIVCLILLILSSDEAMRGRKKDYLLLQFIQKLLNEDAFGKLSEAKPSRSRTSDEGSKTFQDAFKDSRIYFTHFIKVHDSRVVNRKFLWGLIARGAAVLCADVQAGMNIVLPFLYNDPKLGRRNVSAILIQTINDRRDAITPKPWLFEEMDPYFVGLFDPDEQAPLPVIRMVFALSSRSPAVEIMKPVATKDAYTAYDVWCAGTFAATFGVITKHEEDTYQELLKVCNPFSNADESKSSSIEALRRSMNPGTEAYADHWIGFEEVAEDRNVETS